MNNPNPTELPVEVQIAGLKCDAPSCGYRDDSIQLAQYEAHINAPCPNCGAPLLTQADYDNVQVMIETTNFINSLSTDELAALSALANAPSENLMAYLNNMQISETAMLTKAPNGGMATLLAEMNGTGSVTFTLETEPEPERGDNT